MIVCSICNFSYDSSAAGGTCPRCALTRALAVTADPAPPDDFDFIAELGRGAMGRVSLVRQRSLDRLVALKVIAVGARPLEWLEARLLREARAVAQLQHPHIVAVHEVGHGPAGAFLAMEYCEGGDLRAQLRQNPLAPRAAAELVAKLADAIAHAHAAGVLHRDLKPSNILLTATGEPKISDFGLTASVASSGAGELTQTGEIAGSPSYLAPETLQAGVRPTPAVDVYGLGSILYECVTGRPPFTGESSASVLAQIVQTEPAAPRVLNAGIPRDLETIILECLEKNPLARYATALALRDDLRRFIEGRPIVARPISVAERAWRWARRSPALAASLALALLLLVSIAVVSTASAVRLDREHRLTSAALVRTTAAEADAREQLRAALLAQARATRFTLRSGQRFDALDAIRRAAAIRPDLDARNEAIAALTLPDWEIPKTPVKAWSDPFQSTVAPFPGFATFMHETEKGVFSRRTFPGGATQWTWPGRDSPSAGTTVVSPDGRWVAVRLNNDEIHVLDAATGNPLFQLPGRTYGFKYSGITAYDTDMAFSPDGSRFAATRPEGGVTFHHMPDGALMHEWTTPEWIIAISYSHDGHRLAAGSRGHRLPDDQTTYLISLVDADTGRELLNEKQTSRVNFIEWSDDDRWIALGTKPVQVRASADLAARNIVPETAGLYARFLPDGQRLLISEQTTSTKLWDIDRGRMLLEKGDNGVKGAWFDGPPFRQWRSFSSGEVELSIFHDSPIFSSIRRRSGENDTTTPWADAVDVSPDGRWMVIGNWAGPKLIDLATLKVVSRLILGLRSSSFVARFDATGESLWIGETEGPLRRCSFIVGPDGKPVIGPGEIIPGYDGFLPTALHRGTHVLALTHYRDGQVRLLDTRTRRLLSKWSLPKAMIVAFSPDGQLALSNAAPMTDARAEIHEVATGRLVRALGEGAGRQSQWSHDGRFVLAGTGERTLGLWRTETWKPAGALPVNFQYDLSACAFSPDNRMLAIKDERALVLLRLETLEILARLEIPGTVDHFRTLRFTDDSQRLLTVDRDCELGVWDLSALRTELRQLGLDWKD